MPVTRVILCVCAAVLCMSAPPAHAQPLALTFRNGANLGSTTIDQFGQVVTVTGLSGLVHLGGSRWLAVMDNSSRVVFIDIAINANGAIASATITGAFTLAQSHDHEDISLTGPLRFSTILCEEDTPALREYSLADGSMLGTLPLSPVFASRRANFGLESLTRRTFADGTAQLWTANEEALSVDGPISTSSAGTTIRIQQFTRAAGFSSPYVAAAAFAYTTQPIHGNTINGARSGVSGLVLLPDGRLLTLERSFALVAIIPSFQTRIYELDLAGATDISGPAFASGLVGQPYTPASKRLLYQGNQTNLEGLALGPRLPSGSWSLLGVIDDGDPISVNRICSFELTGPPWSCHCPGDIDESGSTDPADLAAFVNLWLGGVTSGTPAADFDADGSLTPADIAAFVNAWLGSLAGSC